MHIAKPNRAERYEMKKTKKGAALIAKAKKELAAEKAQEQLEDIKEVLRQIDGLQDTLDALKKQVKEIAG